MAQNAALRLFGFRQFAAPIETRARPDGSFLFPRVFPGEYTLRLAGAAPDNISAPELAVTIGDSDVEGVVIEAPRLKKVHGRMTVEGRGPAPRFTLSLKSEAQSGAPKYGHFEINPGRDGTFNVVLPEGSWEVAEQSLRVGYILQSLMYGEHDLMRGPLNLAMDDPAAELRISVKAPEDSGVTIAGRVVGASSGAEGRPVAVTLRSPSFTEDLSAAVSGDGTFVFPVVYPARYLAIVRVSGKSAPGSEQIVEVSDLPVRDLEMRVPARSRVKGTIDVRGGAPPPRVSIPLFPAHVEPLLMPRFLNDEPLFRPTLEFDPLRDEGFSVDLPEGEYLLDPTAFELPPGYGIDSFTYGTTDLLKENLRVTRADTTTLRLTLRRN
jgi:hypothetical protein